MCVEAVIFVFDPPFFDPVLDLLAGDVKMLCYIIFRDIVIADIFLYICKKLMFLEIGVYRGYLAGE